MITNIKISHFFIQNCLNKEIYLVSQLFNSDELLLSKSLYLLPDCTPLFDSNTFYIESDKKHLTE